MVLQIDSLLLNREERRVTSRNAYLHIIVPPTDYTCIHYNPREESNRVMKWFCQKSEPYWVNCFGWGTSMYDCGVYLESKIILSMFLYQVVYEPLFVEFYERIYPWLSIFLSFRPQSFRFDFWLFCWNIEETPWRWFEGIHYILLWEISFIYRKSSIGPLGCLFNWGPGRGGKTRGSLSVKGALSKSEISRQEMTGFRTFCFICWNIHNTILQLNFIKST